MEEAGKGMDVMVNNMKDSMERADNQVEDACKGIKDEVNAANRNC